LDLKAPAEKDILRASIFSKGKTTALLNDVFIEKSDALEAEHKKVKPFLRNGCFVLDFKQH
jgi:hypothetical protein